MTELEKTKELIQKAKAFAPNEETIQLIESFEEFSELYYQKELNGGNPEFVQKLTDAQGKFWTRFTKMATKQGMNALLLKEHFDNPENLQAAKEAVLKEQPVPTRTHSKKLRKNNKRVRI